MSLGEVLTPPEQPAVAEERLVVAHKRRLPQQDAAVSDEESVR